MLHRTIISAFITAFTASLLSLMLVQTAAAYPLTARSATTTVSGAYRPIDLDLSLQDGTDALTYTGLPIGTGSMTFTALFGGTYDGYSASGDAGDWLLTLSDTFEAGVQTLSYSYSTSYGGTTSLLSMESAGAGLKVGELTYGGGLTDIPPAGDTPSFGDMFELYTSSAGTVLSSSANLTYDTFTLSLEQDLLHLGPFSVANKGYLDTDRTNEECLIRDDGYIIDTTACGSLTLQDVSSSEPEPAVSVPEPASIALFGLGLVGLGLSRRRARG